MSHSAISLISPEVNLVNWLNSILKTQFGWPAAAKPDDVKKITGYTIGGVSPVGHLNKVKIYIDNNLERFTTIFAAAGHPNCVFKIGFTQLTKLTTGEKKEITEWDNQN